MRKDEETTRLIEAIAKAIRTGLVKTDKFWEVLREATSTTKPDTVALANSDTTKTPP